MTDEELNAYFDVLSKEHSFYMQKWLEIKDESKLDECISRLTEEEKDALLILLIMKFTEDAKKEFWR